MNLKDQIPNLLTSANLVCGAIAAVNVSVFGIYTPAVFLVFLAAIFDLFDGAVARMLKVDGEMGKQLDSLADVVSFGLVPSIIVYKLLDDSLPLHLNTLKYLAFANVVAAAVRLARFNISVNQTKDFSGMPSPANGIFWASIAAPFAWKIYSGDLEIMSNTSALPLNFVLTMLAVTSLLMVSSVRMFSFKFKSGGIKANLFPSIYVAIILIVGTLSIVFTGQILTAVPVCIIVYMILSFAYHFFGPDQVENS